MLARSKSRSNGLGKILLLEERTLLSATPLDIEPRIDLEVANLPQATPQFSQALEIKQSSAAILKQPPDREEAEQRLQSQHPTQSPALFADQTQSPQHASANQQTDRFELVIIDPAAMDHEQLVNDVLDNQIPDRQVEVFVLDPNQNGIEQLSEILSGYDDLDAIHIVSHGTDGQVKLGSEWLNLNDLETYGQEIQSWSDALSADADILFYGCDLASNANGQQLIQELSELTGADVAASTDDTGNAELGGDWELEYATGSVETNVAFSAELQENWSGLLATFTVTNTNDSGGGSLRQAILDANASPGVDTITFNIGGGGVQTIQPTSLLPAITDPVILDATTQPGFAGVPIIEIDGTFATGSDENGLTLQAGNSTVRGFVINRFGDDGIEIEINGGNTIEGNYIGTDVTGTLARPNDYGISIKSDGNTIGGTTLAQRNLFSGNTNWGIGLYAGAANNIIEGNYVGTDISGSADLGNSANGVEIYGGANNNTIGGTAAGAGNVISGNNLDGVHIIDSGTTSNMLQGNLIGTNAAGNADLGNSSDGITITNGATGNVIGGTTAQARNIISGNNNDGVDIGSDGNFVIGNFIGTDIAGAANIGNSAAGVRLFGGASGNEIGRTAPGTGNTIAYSGSAGVIVFGAGSDSNIIRSNSIHSNAGLGIDLGNDGVDTNDGAPDSDSGANQQQDYPVLTAATISGSDLTVTGFLSSTPNTAFDFDFFASTTPDATGHGEAERFIGSAVGISTDNNGDLTLNELLSGASVSAGEFITATATDQFGNTSEFSLNAIAANVSAPGGIAADLTLWLKADAGVTTGSGGVRRWDNQVANATLPDVQQSTSSNRPDLNASALNFNPVITFDGTDDDLNDTSVLGTDLFASDAGSIFTVARVNSGGVIVQWLDTLNNRVTIEGTNPRFDFGDLVNDRLDGSGTPPGYHIVNAGATPGTPTNLAINVDGALNASSAASSANPLDPTQTGQFFLGQYPLGGFNAAMDLAEVVIFKSDLNPGDQQKVESYLAVKYGITLDQTTPTNYVDTASNVIWDATANAGYNNDIAGIGRDDPSLLNQIQSRSINIDSILTISSASNQDNGEFLLWGNDNGSFTETASGNPAGVAQQLQRIWKVAETGEVGSTTLTFDVNSLPVSGTVASDFNLIIDTDTDFSAGSTVVSASSYIGGIVTFNGVNLGDGQFFTLGTDEAVAAVMVTPTSGLTTTEAGATANFSVVLNSQPNADVNVGIFSSDPTEGTVSTSNLLFTTMDWSTPKFVTITGVDDLVDDGDIGYTIVTTAATSADPSYNGLNANDVSVTNTDDDVAGISVSPTSGLVTTEAGGTANFTVVLDTKPTANVTIGISSSDTTEGTVSTSSLTFTTTNWNVAQNVNVTGVDDLSADGNIAYTIVTAAATSADGNYAGIDAADVSLTNNDNDTAGITVAPTAGLNTTETGGTDTFSIVLDTLPLAPVTIGISSNDASEGSVSATSVTFTLLNWNTPQIITVTGVDDSIDDGDVGYSIVTAAATSIDPFYNAVDAADVSITNSDDDSAAITVTPTAGLITDEGGLADTFDVVLTSEPTASVTVSVVSSDPSEGTVSTGSLVFDNTNWNLAQTVTVTGQDDVISDGNVGYAIVLGAAVSGDGSYNGLDPTDVSVTNNDDDTAGITVIPTAGLITDEGGLADTFDVILSSAPTAAVTISVVSSDPSEGSVSTSSLVFDNTNWNVAQTVTVTGQDDVISDGNIGYTIVLGAAVSGDGNYNGLDPTDVSVTNNDDDTAGITVTPTAGLITDEGGLADAFDVVLTSAPTAAVTISVTSSDPGEGTVSTNSLVFDNTNWNVAQTVTVTGQDDAIADGNVAYMIVLGAAVSGDGSYNGMDPTDVSVTNNDDDTAGITVTPNAGLVTDEGGLADTFDVVLTSAPTAAVTISVTSSDPGEGTVSTNSLVFDNTNWNIAQTVTVTGQDDATADGNIGYTIVLGAAVSGDGSYNGMDPTDVSVTNNDDDTAGITITPTAGLITDEGGLSDTFDVVLTSAPTAAVTISVTSSDPGEGAVSTSSLVFDNTNWNIAQTVTVTGQDDATADGNIAYTIVTGPAVSADGNYSGLDASDVSVTNNDNDISGITVNPVAGLTTTEAGGTAVFSVVLDAAPTANVTLGIFSGDTTEGTVSTGSLTFTTGNWNAPQIVTITGVDDPVDDGDIAYTVITAPAISADPVYNGLNAADVSVTNTNDDVAGITVIPTSGLTTTEAGGTDTFTVVLDSQPTGNVIIGLASSDNSEGIVSTPNLVFTNVNWNTPQIVTVTGVDDAVDDGDKGYAVTTAAAASGDAKYSGLNAANVAVMNLDDDLPGPSEEPPTKPEDDPSGGGDPPVILTKDDAPTLSPANSNSLSTLPTVISSFDRQNVGQITQAQFAVGNPRFDSPAASVSSTAVSALSSAARDDQGGGSAEYFSFVPSQGSLHAEAYLRPYELALDLVSQEMQTPSETYGRAGPRFGELDLPSLNGPGRDSISLNDEFVATGAFAATGLIATAGYVLLNTRAVALLLSLLAARQAWQELDPLQVIYAWEQKQDQEEESLASMVE